MKIHGSEGFSLKDLVDIDQDPNYRTATTPMGAEKGEVQRYIGGAVDWKGADGRGAFGGEGNKTKEDLRNQGVPQRVIDGLEKATTMSKQASGVKGMALVERPDGVQVQMSAKSAVQALAGKKPYKLVEMIPNQLGQVTAKTEIEDKAKAVA